VERSGLSFDASAPFAPGETLGEALLIPTRLYVKSCLAAIRNTGAVKAMAHITGGGFPDNVPRALPTTLGVQAALAAAQAYRPAVEWVFANPRAHRAHVRQLGWNSLGRFRDYVAPTGSVTGQPVVEKDASGAPTGVVMEMDNLIPFPRPSREEVLPALESGVAELFTRYGVTTIGEISETLNGLRAFRRGIESGSIAARLNVYLWAPGTVSLQEATDPALLAQLRGEHRDRFDITGVKVFADGGFSAAQAAISTEYLHAPGSCGSVALAPDEVAEAYRATREAGLQLAIHANGDRTQLEVCRALATARERFGEHPGVRIEHAGNYVPDYPALAQAWRAAGILPVPQPIFLKNFGEFVPDYVGETAWQAQFPFRTMLADGWPISGSSDVWVGSDEHQSNPFRSIAATLNRRTFHGQLLA